MPTNLVDCYDYCALILFLIYVPDEIQGKIFHGPLEYPVKCFILLCGQVMFPVSNAT